jgi:hypothetical protein
MSEYGIIPEPTTPPIISETAVNIIRLQRIYPSEVGNDIIITSLFVFDKINLEIIPSTQYDATFYVEDSIQNLSQQQLTLNSQVVSYGAQNIQTFCNNFSYAHSVSTYPRIGLQLKFKNNVHIEIGKIDIAGRCVGTSNKSVVGLQIQGYKSSQIGKAENDVIYINRPNSIPIFYQTITSEYIADQPIECIPNTSLYCDWQQYFCSSASVNMIRLQRVYTSADDAIELTRFDIYEKNFDNTESQIAYNMYTVSFEIEDASSLNNPTQANLTYGGNTTTYGANNLKTNPGSTTAFAHTDDYRSRIIIQIKLNNNVEKVISKIIVNQRTSSLTIRERFRGTQFQGYKAFQIGKTENGVFYQNRPNTPAIFYYNNVDPFPQTNSPLTIPINSSNYNYCFDWQGYYCPFISIPIPTTTSVNIVRLQRAYSQSNNSLALTRFDLYEKINGIDVLITRTLYEASFHDENSVSIDDLSQQSLTKDGNLTTYGATNLISNPGSTQYFAQTSSENNRIMIQLKFINNIEKVISKIVLETKIDANNPLFYENMLIGTQIQGFKASQIGKTIGGLFYPYSPNSPPIFYHNNPEKFDINPMEIIPNYSQVCSNWQDYFCPFTLAPSNALFYNSDYTKFQTNLKGYEPKLMTVCDSSIICTKSGSNFTQYIVSLESNVVNNTYSEAWSMIPINNESSKRSIKYGDVVKLRSRDSRFVQQPFLLEICNETSNINCNLPLFVGGVNYTNNSNLWTIENISGSSIGSYVLEGDSIRLKSNFNNLYASVCNNGSLTANCGLPISLRNDTFNISYITSSYWSIYKLVTPIPIPSEVIKYNELIKIKLVSVDNELTSCGGFSLNFWRNATLSGGSVGTSSSTWKFQKFSNPENTFGAIKFGDTVQILKNPDSVNGSKYYLESYGGTDANTPCGINVVVGRYEYSEPTRKWIIEGGDTGSWVTTTQNIKLRNLYNNLLLSVCGTYLTDSSFCNTNVSLRTDTQASNYESATTWKIYR